MPELPQNKYCPVQSFLTYKISLAHDKDFLWQKPKMINSQPKVKVHGADLKG